MAVPQALQNAGLSPFGVRYAKASAKAPPRTRVILTGMPMPNLPSAAPATIAIGQPMAARAQDGSAGVLLAIAVDREDTHYLIAAHGKGAPMWYPSSEMVAVTRGS